MKKHLHLLALLAAICLPWAMNAQAVSGCAYTTGVDTTKWITLSSSATEITAIYDDDAPSSCIDIGFNFYFGGNTYTQFSCNSNGRFRLGPTAVSNYWTGPFTTLTDASYNDLPFVTAYGADNTLAGSGVYVKYELVGTAPNRILVVEYLTPSVYDEDGDLVNYQIQLLEDSNRVRLVYGSTAATTYDDYQIGIAGTATDYLMVNAATHATLTTPTSFVNDSWPGVGRYYQFTMGMPPSCPAITAINVDRVSVGSALLSWTYGTTGSPVGYEMEYYAQGSTTTPATLTSTTPNAILTGLDSNTTYVFRVRVNCGTDGYGAWDSTTFTTESFGCIYDPSSMHSFTSGTGTTQTSGVPVNSSWGNTLCQGIYTAAELIAAGFPSTGADITDLTFTWTNNSSYAKYFTIYMVNTTKDVFGGTTATEWVATGASAKVYEGEHPLNTSGAVTYHLTTPFHWDGTSNICVTTTMNQPSGASHTGSGFYGYSTTLSSYYRTLYKYQDSNPLDGSNPAATAASSRSYYRTNITFQSQTCMGMATCAAPLMWIDSMTAHEAYLSWIPGFNETSWDVQYRLKGNTAWTTATTGVTATTATVTTLTPGTQYEFRVVTTCGTDTYPSTIEEGITDCVPVTHTALPYTYGFEDLTASSGAPLGFCWARGYYSGSYNPNSYPYASTSYYHTGSKALYFYASGTTIRSWLCMPEFEDSISNLRLQFWAKKSSTTYSGLIKVGVMSDPTNYNTFQLLRTEYTDGTTNWQHFDVSLANAPATGRITIMVEAGSGSNYIYVDDITVDEIPYCTTPVVDSVIVTTTDADIYLSDVDHADDDITVTLTAGTWDTTLVEYASPISVTGLTPGTTYTYSIVAHCSSTQTSNARTGSFMTECSPIAHDDLPFDYGFEDIATTGSGIPLAPCWDRGYLSGSTFYDNNYPYASTSYYHSGTKSLYFYGSGTTTRSWLCLPEFEDSIYSLQISFWAEKTSTSYNGRIIVGVMTDPHTFATFQPVDTVTISSTSTWTHFEVSLADAPGTGYITIMNLPGSGSNYFYLDDIHVDVIPTCLTPTGLAASNIGLTTADLTWNTRLGNETAWLVGNGRTEVEVYDTNYTVTGLMPSSTNTVTVRALCGTGDTSEMAYLTVTTPCGLVPPYSYGFEDMSTTSSSSHPNIPCWHHLNNGTSNPGYPYITSTAHTGTRGLYWYGSTTTGTYGDYYYVVLPMLDTANYQMNSLRVRFWARASSTSYHPVVRVGVMTDPTDVSTLQVVNGNVAINPGSSTAWAEFTVDLDTFTGNGAYIAIGALRPSSIWYMYMDDISVVQIPDCDGVTNFVATNVTTSQADISWTEHGNATGWTIEYGPHGFVRGSSAGSTETVALLPHTLYGLTANTEYDVYVTPDCSGLAETNMFTFRTECAPMITLPYTYGFEDLATGSTTIAPVINCWHHLNNSSSYPGYPYVSSTAHNGSRSLYWYNPSSAGTYSDYQTIVLPAIDTDLYPINTLQLKFWAKASGTSYSPVFQVGVMSDPNNVNTFQRLQTINVGSSAVWTEYVAALGNFTGTGQYIAVHAPIGGASWYAYTDDFTIEAAPQCPPITNMEVSSVSARSAFITWDYRTGTVGTPQEYEIEYYEVGSTATPISLTDTLPQIFLSGLDTNTTYCVRVRANCFEYEYGTWSSITFTTTGLGCLEVDTTTQTNVNFSTGTSTSSGVLVYSSYGNTMYQTIYTASELLAAGITSGGIGGVDFGFAANSSYAKEFTIFIGSTTKSSFSSATDYVNPATMQQVYGPTSYPIYSTAGWRHFDFDNPFIWDGSSNIIVCTFMNQPSGTSHTISSFTGYYTAGPTNSSVYRYKDSNPFTLANYTTSTGGSVISNRASVHFYVYGCSQQATCAAPMVRATRIGSRDADIEWAAGAYETAWDVEYRMTSSPSWTTVATGTTTTSYTMLNLLPATEYQFRVSHYCAADDTTYTTLLTFTTECEPYTVPFIEDFDSYVASSATQLGNCWNKYYSSLNTSSYPYPYASYHHSGNNSLYFYGYSTSYPCWLVLPQMADSLRTLELSFWEYKTTTSYGLVEIGVITDPQDLSTFVPVDTVQVSATSNWQQFFVNFQNYEGPEGRIAMVARTSSSYSFYIDDLEVNRYSTCPRVQSLAATRVTNDSAFLTWQGDSNSLGYRVWWGNSNVITDATDSADLTNARLILGGLGANQTRYVWVSQFCDGGEMSAPVRTVFTTAADCEVVTDLDVHYVTSNSAVFTWNAPEEGYPAARYIVNWQSTSSTVYADTTTDNYYFLSGLDTTTTYSFSVIAICEHESIYDTSFAVSSTFTTHGTRCNYIYGLGTSTSTSSAPLYVTYPYYYGHMLFFADELAQMGDTITSLTFNVTTSGSVTRNVDVYMGNSDYENLYTPAFPAYSTLTQVYSGNWTVQNGQCTLTFTTPFVRDHSRNLVVGFDDNTGTANSSSFSFSAAYTINSSTGENIYTVHYNEAQANVNPAIDQAVHVTYVRPIITFGTSCASESCSSPALVVSGNSDSTISLVWNANSGSAWRVEYRLPTDSVWTVADSNVTTNSYVVSGLRVASRYALRVGSICSPTQILYTPIYGETACGDALVPYTDDFNDIVNGWYERTCWRVGNGFNAARSETSTGSSSTYNYPRVVNLTQQGPMLRLYNGAYAVMPHFAEPLYNLQVRFDYLTPFTSDAWTLFGYLTDPNDITTMVVIDTLRHHPTVEGVRLYTIDLDFLSGDVDGNLVFYTPHTLNFTHIDNIYVDLIPPCAIPDSLTCSYAADTSADLGWYMSNIGSATYMVRYTAYRSGVYDTVYTTGTSTTLTGLIPGTTYDAECYSICLRTGDTSLASNVCRFTTQCAPLPTLPYFLNFEDIPLSTTQTLPNCWEVPVAASMDAAALPQCLFDNPNAAAGYYYLRVQTAAAIAMPQFVAPPDSLMISFYMKTATAGDMVEVGVFDTLVEPVVFRPMDTFATSSTSYEFFSSYMVGYTGPGTRLGIRTLGSGTVYIDNLTIDYAPTCVPVRRLRVDTATASTLTLAWTDLTAASQYEIEYGNTGFTQGNGTRTIVTSNPATILGLTSMTNYDFYVRPICSVGDTADWSSVCHGTTAMCDNLVTANSWDSTWTATTSNYVPLGYSFYNYGYIQTIIDSARFAEVEDVISAFAFSTASSERGEYYNHMDVYMANVSDSNLSAGFILPDTNHQFVQVLHDADLRFATAGWHLHGFDTAFTWDGHSNVLVVFNRRHGSYVSSPYASFNGHTTSVAKSRYAQQDGTTPFDPTNITATGTTQNLVPDLQFYSCAANCNRPDIASVTGDYQSATLTWVGTDSLYQVAIRTLLDTAWSTPVDVVGNTYTFTNLQPLTNYELRVRQNCTADSLGYSAWMSTYYRTDTLPCFAPETLTVSNITSTTATFGWVAIGDETAWNIRVYTTAFDTLYTVTTNPATVSGLTAGVTYYAAVRALCGNAQEIPGNWSDSIQFTTQVCPTVTGVTSSNVTFNSVTLNWPAATLAQGYEVEYGLSGFTQGNGTRVNPSTNSITVTGLMDETSYDFYVRAVCGTDWTSESWSTVVTVTTLSAPSTTFNITATVNPTNAGTVTGTGVYAQGDTATLTATANTGYTFSRWNDNVTLNPRSVVVTSDSAFTAFFTRNQYTVTVTSADQTRGTVTGNGTYYYGDTATLTATAATGYHFTQWNDGDTHATRSIVVTSDTTFTASFGVNQYTVTATANDASMGTVTGGGQYNFRDTVTLTATANTGYYFRSWNDGNVDNPRTFVVTGDVTYTALFAADSVPPVQTYTVTLNANDANMGIVNGAGTFAEGTSVEISAIANAGYRFVNWNDGVTDNPRTFVLTCDTTFTANFAEQVDSSAVLVVSFDGQMGTVYINGAEASTYNGTLGDEVSLRAVAYDGYHFVEWSDGETAAERTIVLEQSRTTLTATFAIGSGIATVEGNASCLIYPNPATSSTTISVSGVNGKVRIAVVDINGRVAASETMECAGDCVKTMNVDNLSQGAYFVRITGEKVNMVKKLIVR